MFFKNYNTFNKCSVLCLKLCFCMSVWCPPYLSIIFCITIHFLYLFIYAHPGLHICINMYMCPFTRGRTHLAVCVWRSENNLQVLGIALRLQSLIVKCPNMLSNLNGWLNLLPLILLHLLNVILYQFGKSLSLTII